MYHLDNFYRLVNDKKWQPTREDIALLLRDLRYYDVTDSLVRDRLQNIVNIYNGINNDEDVTPQAIIEMMVYQARCGIEDLEREKVIRKRLDDIEALKHKNQNEFIPDLEDRIKTIEAEIQKLKA